MIGTLDPSKKSVTVVGGGIAGLLMAYRLDQLGYEVTLLEAQGRMGGLIQTEQTPWGIAESAAHSILATESVQCLFKELGVELLPGSAESKKRYIARNGKLRRFPLSFLETLKTLFRLVFARANSEVNSKIKTVGDWARFYFGKPALDYLLTPMLRGIYGVASDEVSLDAAFPQFRVPIGQSFLSFQLSKIFKKRKSKTSSLLRPSMMTPKYGMESLVRALESRLRAKLGNRLKLNQSIQELPKDGNLILAMPASSAAILLQDVDPRLSVALAQVKYTPLVCMTVFIKKEDLEILPQGVGVLMPEAEKSRCLGILFNSSAFAERVTDPSKFISCTVMLGGSKNPEALEWTDLELLSIAKEEISRFFKFHGEFVNTVIRRWKNAIPRYDENLTHAWTIAKQSWCASPGRVLFGNYTGQVSLRGMIETVQKGIHFETE